MQVLTLYDAQMSFSDSVFYYWSDKEWDSCDKFRDVATNILNPRGVPDMLEWSASDTQVPISEFRRHPTRHSSSETK